MPLNEHAKEWVKALRSGEYIQGNGFLHYKEKDETDKFCCLGVACDLYIKNGGKLIMGKQGEDIPEPEDIKVFSYDGHNAVLPNQVKDWLDLVSDMGEFKATGSDSQDLAQKNDGGYTFQEIADLIESEPEGLFV